MKKSICLIVVVLLLSLSFTPGIVANEPTFDRTIYVDDDASPGWYDATHVKTIQEGIDNATAGDTVFVYNGTYYENVVVDKTINLTGEDRDGTIIDGHENGDGIQVTADFVEIRSFNIRNTSLPDIGLYINSNNVSIFENVISLNANGFKMNTASYCNFYNNRLVDNQHDITVRESSHNKIYNNILNELLTTQSSNITIENNTYQDDNNYNEGISLLYSLNCIIKNNTFLFNGISINGNNKLHWNSHIIKNNSINNNPIYFYKNCNGGSIPLDAGQVILASCSQMNIQGLNLTNLDLAIQLGYSNHINIKNNSLSNNYGGIMLKWSDDNIIKHNKILGSDGFGFYSLYSYANTISHNLIQDGDEGIGFHNGNYNIIENNTFMNASVRAIRFWFSSDNKIIQNTISNNFFGIHISHSSEDNIIYHNNFLNNSQHAYDDGNNTWDNGYPSGGNYYDDYTGTDSDGDGIGDIPYDIPGGSNQDLYPLGYLHPPENHAPNKPSRPSGETSGKAGEEYIYATTTNDQDGDQIWFKWNWGDGNQSEWIGPYNTGDTCEASYTWTEKDDYEIKVKAKDEHGKESEWSDPLEVTMPKNKPISTLYGNPFNGIWFVRGLFKFLDEDEEYIYLRAISANLRGFGSAVAFYHLFFCPIKISKPFYGFLPEGSLPLPGIGICRDWNYMETYR